MKRWKHFICRCGWRSEAHKATTERILEQCEIHLSRCKLARKYGLPTEEWE